MRLHWLPSAYPAGDPRMQAPADVHARTVIIDHGDAYALCSCGFVSTACEDADTAHALPCEVEALLQDSRIRELRLYARLLTVRH